MINRTEMSRAARIGGPLRAMGGLVLLIAASQAPAAVIVTSNSSSTVYGMGFLGTPSLTTAQTGTVRMAANVAGFPAELGLDFTSSSSNHAFSFLQSQYCVGKCTTYALTTVTLTLDNTGNAAEAMRFDSEITPGHLARVGSNTTASAIFNFDVTETTAGTTRTLYAANGQADSTATEITTSDGIAFNGLTRSLSTDYNVLDWSATNLIVLLDSLQPGETSTLTYQSLTRTTTTASQCADITNCGGVQVAFGDPRNDGGGVTLLARRAAPLAVPVPIIGVAYRASAVPLDIVALDAPLPPSPPVLTPPAYDPHFVSQVNPPAGAVPEPAVWLLMIAGFGLVGTALRRRDARLPLVG